MKLLTSVLYDGPQRELASVPYKFFDKKTGSGVSVNKKLAEDIHKPVIKKIKRRKLHAKFKDNICQSKYLLSILS